MEGRWSHDLAGAPVAIEDWPAEVSIILSALEAAGCEMPERRESKRMRWRVRGHLRLYTDGPDSLPWVLYTRDASPRSLGFISPHRLPLGYGGTVELMLPEGRVAEIPCTILRCREAVPGWCDGSLYFNREQWCFEVEQ